MAKTFKVKIVTLSKVVTEENVEKFFTKTANGNIEIMYGHAPIIVSTVPCITVIEKGDGTKLNIATAKGVVNISNNELTFCCNSVETAEEIDLDRAKQSKERAEARLHKNEKIDKERAKLSLARALVRIDLKEHSN